jgi:hypothetical protein
MALKNVVFISKKKTFTVSETLIKETKLIFGVNIDYVFLKCTELYIFKVAGVAENIGSNL